MTQGHRHAAIALEYWTEAHSDKEAWNNWEYKEWHWSCEEYQGNASSACGCGFGDGNQYNGHKDDELAAVAVRYITLEG